MNLESELLSRITSSSDIRHGRYVVRGLRYPIADLLTLMAPDMTEEESLEDYSDLEVEDLKACILLAANSMKK